MRDYKKEKFIDRFKESNITRAEAERKYKLKLEEERIEEERKMFEAMNAKMAAQALNVGGSSAAVGGSTDTTPPPPPPPAGPESSGTIVFDGASQYVLAPNAQVVTWLPGTGDFTIEWFMKKGTGGTSFPRVFSLGFNTGATIGCSIEGGTCYIWPYGNSLKGAMPAGYNNSTAWTHIAISRSGTSTKLFIDGVLKMTKTGDSRSINDSINPGFDLNMGVDDPTSGSANWWAGSLTNFRWNNSAIYTGASLTVPTAPLTKDADTKLLMLGGTISNPVFDSTYVNSLENHGATWDADTPFV